MGPPVGDFEPDGDWYSMIAAGGALYPQDAQLQPIVTAIETLYAILREDAAPLPRQPASP